MTSAGFSAEDVAIDHELADVALSFRFLLDLTPTDIAAARAQFGRDERDPVFTYRPLEDDPSVIDARLDAIALDTVEDPTLAHLLLAKERELRLQVEMLRCRGAEDFLSLSLELYGAVPPALLAEAVALLEHLPPPPPSADAHLDAEGFAARARDELDHYRAEHPDLQAHVEIRAGTTGVMVANGELLIAPSVRVPEHRVEALLQHEVGTHLVTHVNGAHQPVHVLEAGLAGYEETQEGLAVLAEHLVGGLTLWRLRQLAARVVAVHDMVEGATFREVHRRLTAAGVASGTAFTITMRAFRGGGLTKDAVYLRGLHDVVAHLRAGGELDVLWLGKLPLTDAPLVRALRDRGALAPARLQPRYLSAAGTADRLAKVRETTSLTDLIGAAA